MARALTGVEQDPAALTAKPYLSPDEASVVLGVGRVTIYRLIRSGALPSVRLGRLIKVPTAQLAGSTRRFRRRIHTSTRRRQRLGEPNPSGGCRAWKRPCQGSLAVELSAI